MEIDFFSDPIGNTGVKKFISLFLPNLRAITLRNTNITTDVIKVLVKKISLKFQFINLEKSKHFIFDLLFKQIA